MVSAITSRYSGSSAPLCRTWLESLRKPHLKDSLILIVDRQLAEKEVRCRRPLRG